MLVRCQNCDERLGKYQCGKGHSELRQVLADITQVRVSGTAGAAFPSPCYPVPVITNA